MTICEFFHNQFHEAVQKGAGTKYVCKISEDIPRNSYEWVKLAADYFFGGAYYPTLLKAGITREQLQKAKESGYLKYQYYNNWQARQLGQTEYWSLTRKGLKALYRAYEGQW